MGTLIEGMLCVAGRGGYVAGVGTLSFPVSSAVNLKLPWKKEGVLNAKKIKQRVFKGCQIHC